MGRSCTDGDKTAISWATWTAVTNSAGFWAEAPTRLSHRVTLASSRQDREMGHHLHIKFTVVVKDVYVTSVQVLLVERGNLLDGSSVRLLGW